MYQTGSWCSGITPAQHAGGPGLNPQRVHLAWARYGIRLLRAHLTWLRVAMGRLLFEPVANVNQCVFKHMASLLLPMAS